MPDPKRPAESYARIYDDALDNLKTSGLRPDQFGLFWAMISYSHRCDTDGAVPWDKAKGLLNFSSQGFTAAIRALEKAKLLERDGQILTVHHYDLHNETHAERNARRIAASNAARIRWGNAESNATGNTEGNARNKEKVKEKEGLENKETKAKLETKVRSVEPNGSTALEIEVFETWKTSTGKSGKTRLDPKRHRLIRQALAEYPVEDVLDAVEGWSSIPHNRGENDQRRKFNDLELLLRDSQHIERFRDAKRGQGEAVAVESGAEYHRLWVDPYAAEEAARDAQRKAGHPD